MNHRAATSAAMWCLAFVIFAHRVPLRVWPPPAAVLLNVVGGALLTNQEMHQGTDPANLARGLHPLAFVVGVLGLAVAVDATVPFFVLTV